MVKLPPIEIRSAGRVKSPPASEGREDAPVGTAQEVYYWGANPSEVTF